MASLRRLLLVTIALFITSCGGGISSSGSGSGIGGTGITLVSGNVSSINGQLFVHLAPESKSGKLIAISDWIIPASHAQVSSISSLIVSGGGQSVEVSPSGTFALPNVTPSDHFVLTFTVNGNQSIPMPIGQVQAGAAVIVKDIAIDTQKSQARPSEIDVVEQEERKEISDDVEDIEDIEIKEGDQDSEDAEDAEDARDETDDEEDEEDEKDEVDEKDEDDGK